MAEKEEKKGAAKKDKGGKKAERGTAKKVAAVKKEEKKTEKDDSKEQEKREEKAEDKPEKKEETQPKEKKEEKKEVVRTKKSRASAKITDAKISLKDSRILCNRIRGKRVSKSKAFLKGLLDRTSSLNGKYYTNSARKILEVLVNAESSATAHYMDPERLFIYEIRADKGRTFYRPRSGLRRRGERAKMTHIEITVGEK